MASVGEGKANRDHLMCPRCGGLMVSDFCMDLMNNTGELELTAKRCVQCGEVVDPVIQRNRQLRQEPIVDRQIMGRLTSHHK